MQTKPYLHYEKSILILYLCLVAAIGFGSYALALETDEAELKTSGGSLISKVAPGEFLPVSVKLLNFGSGRRVDVTIDYNIFSNGNVILTEQETVAVETTASFVKLIQIPLDMQPGKYTARSSIVYKDQVVPATAQFQFTVEKKIAGIFISQFIVYSVITLLVGTGFSVVSRMIIKKRRTGRLIPHDYSKVEKDERIFYEIISDTIGQMRFRAGDDALEIAQNIPGLKIDGETGKVLDIERNPAKIIALLVLRYETLLGRKVSFAPRKKGQKAEEKLASAKKNVEVVRKYFE